MFPNFHIWVGFCGFHFFLYPYYSTNIVTPCSINIVTTGLKGNKDGEESNEKKNTHGAKQGALKNQLLKASMAFLLNPGTALVAREVTVYRRNKWENRKITIVMPYNYKQSAREYSRGHCCGWDWEWLLYSHVFYTEWNIQVYSSGNLKQWD